MTRLRGIRTVEELDKAGLIPHDLRDDIAAVERRYAVAITPTMLALIGRADNPNGDPNGDANRDPNFDPIRDPIGRQFIPDPAELYSVPHETPDPFVEEALSPVKGIVHRYPDRVLLKPLLACPVYCRFCFRREQVGPDGGVLTEAELRGAYEWLSSHSEIREVILTGGDPFMLSPRRLGEIIAALGAIPHLEIVRVHTRVPLTEPDRITGALASALRTEKAIWIVLHANHPREFTETGRGALRLLQENAIPVLGQSVLLRGVNDNAGILEDLFRTMLSARVKPYYLHQLDPAPGTSRFHVPIEEGRRLLAELRGRVTGLAWPTYVLDIPGGHGKVPINPDYLEADDRVRDPEGIVHRLSPPSAAQSRETAKG